ncbi:MAG: hypothetical protein FH753_06880 [Firmicutes bacterium]|nr:hypothetical protein [Bacillota bacterium]
MVKLVLGSRGTGKTTKLIQKANEDIKKCAGDIAFIDADNKNMYNLNHKVRLINAMEFDINNIENFHGFLCGIIAEDYDIEKVYIDEIYNLIDLDMDKLNDLILKLENLGEKFNTNFILSIDYDLDDVSEDIREYAE